MKDTIKNAYNVIGKDYYESRRYEKGSSYFYNENLEMPATLKLLGKIKGKTILDLGCGPGLYAKILLKKGAKVKGIDFSKELIEIAKREAPGVEFTIGSIEKLPYKKEEFDFVIASLVLGHLSSWKKVLKEVKRVLKKKGIFIFSVGNPFRKISKKIKYKGKYVRIILNYFEERWNLETWKGKKTSVKSAHYHMKYETIIKNILGANFEIIDYKDPKPKPSMKKKYPEEYRMALHMPSFCVWKIQKK